MEGFDVKAMGPQQAPTTLHLVPSEEDAFADRAAYLCRSRLHAEAALQMLISKDYAAKRRPEIDKRRPGATRPEFWRRLQPPLDFAGRDGDTIYATVADSRGNVVSMIQSLFDSFGAGIVAGETGITLHNRGSGFVLTQGHSNQIAPPAGGRSTLGAAMILKEGRPWNVVRRHGAATIRVRLTRRW